MKRLLSFVLVLAQMGAVSAFAGDQTPEFKLLESSIAITGQRLSPDQVNARLGDTMMQYVSEAAPENREIRLADAMVELQLATPAQAQEIANEFRIAAANLRTKNLKGEALAAEASHEISKILTRSKGAQFSESTNDCLVGLGVTLGGIAFLTYGYFDNRDTNPGMAFLSAALAGAFVFGAGTAINDCAKGGESE